MTMSLSPVRINFERLLHRAEILAAEPGAIARDDRGVACEKRQRLYHYVRTLRADAELLSRADATVVRKDEMIEYERRLKSLASLLDDQGLLLTAAVGKTVPSHHRPVEHFAHVAAVAAVTESAKKELFQPAQRLDHDREGPRLRSTASASTQQEKSVDEQLSNQRRIHEHMTDNLVRMAAALKENASAAGMAVRKDIHTLDDTLVHGSTNVEKIQKESGRMKEFIKQSSTLWIWLALILVLLVFCFMLIFIRWVPARK